MVIHVYLFKKKSVLLLCFCLKVLSYCILQFSLYLTRYPNISIGKLILGPENLRDHQYQKQIT